MARKAVISDLFFNHEHPAYATLHEGEDPYDRDELEAAVLEDATEFYEAYGDVIESYLPGAGINAKWLANDFLKRL